LGLFLSRYGETGVTTSRLVVSGDRDEHDRTAGEAGGAGSVDDLRQLLTVQSESCRTPACIQ
jgi:hypothetical protein